MSRKIWKIPFTLSELNERCRNSLSDRIGIEFVDSGDDYLSARMPIDARTLQPMGIMHGGSSAALAETVGSVAANYCVDFNRFYCVGLDLNINHIRPVSEGFVEGIARPLHLGQKTQVWEIKVYDEKKKLVSAARLTLMVLGK